MHHEKSFQDFLSDGLQKPWAKSVSVSDFYSNFRAYKKETLANDLEGGETFGGELLVAAKKKGFKIGEITYEPPPRRCKPRIGGVIRANLRIIVRDVEVLFYLSVLALTFSCLYLQPKTVNAKDPNSMNRHLFSFYELD